MSNANSDRREFLKVAAGAMAAGVWVSGSARGQTPASADQIVVGVVGMGGRGTAVASSFASLPNVVVKYVADVDEGRANAGAKAVGAKAQANKNSPAPSPLTDFRKILDDKDVQAVAIATPNHWHAPAAILACAAEKHVYVEKPCSHNPREGELLVEAARKHERMVQHGTQRRSWPKIVEGIAKVKAGELGPVRLARCWYTNSRKSIGRGKAGPPPAGLDWSLWQGPAPEKDFHDNYVHYNWHWFWHWGNGECGNNGIHSLDVARWGLGVDCPKVVTSGGGRYYFEDDQETPDTQFVTYDYGDKLITWEGKSCHPRGPEVGASGFGIAFYGDNGTIVFDSTGYAIYDLKNKEVAKVPGSGGDNVHTQNLVDAIRGNDPKKLAAPIGEGASSTLLCHLANIAQRTGRTIHLDPAKKVIVDDPEATKLWSREYRKGWEPKV
jgi:predicted dehydrogenase